MMPGSKRRQLKKLLSPSSSSSNTPTPIPSTSTSPAPIPTDSSQTQLTADPAASPSKSTSSLSSLLHLKSPKKTSLSPSPSGSGTGTSPQAISKDGAEGIASDPKNYLTDKQLETDLALEEMAEREKKIGSGMERNGPPVDLNGGNGNGIHAPVPIPASTSASSGVGSLGLGQSQGQGSGQAPEAPGAESLDVRMTSPEPPSASVPAPLAGGISGGMYGKAYGVGGSGVPGQAIIDAAIDGMDNVSGKKGKKKSSKQKFEERQARKKAALLNSAPPSDPDWTAQLEKERQEEIRVISGACEVLGREIYEIAPDGHCMFNAIADQLNIMGLIPDQEAANPIITRRTAAQYMMRHKDDFIAFLPSINGEDSVGATEHDGIMTEKEFGQYCHLVAETGEWGGEPEIQALSRAFNVPIHVIQSGPPTIVSHGGNDDSFGGGLTPEQSAKAGDRVVRISYHRRMYGLGEHYNSLRKVA